MEYFGLLDAIPADSLAPSKSPEHQQPWYCLMCLCRIKQHDVFIQGEFHFPEANQIQKMIPNVNMSFITFNRY